MVIKDLWLGESTTEPPAYKGIYEDLVHKGMDFGVNTNRPGKATADERFLREAYLQGLMTDRDHPYSNNTVPLRGYRKGDKHEYKDDGSIKRTHWRIYLDLLHAGDLSNSIKEHTVEDEFNSRIRHPEHPLPEPFIWWVFMCITEGLLRLESVVQARPNARQEQDEVMAFLDMKPLNILHEKTQGVWQIGFPQCISSRVGKEILRLGHRSTQWGRNALLWQERLCQNHHSGLYSSEEEV